MKVRTRDRKWKFVITIRNIKKEEGERGDRKTKEERKKARWRERFIITNSRRKREEKREV